MITSLQKVQQVQEITIRKGASLSTVIKCQFYEGVRKTSNLPKVRFAQQSSNVPSGIPSCVVEKGPKMPKMIDRESTDLCRSSELANKPRLKYGLFAKFSLSVIGDCKVAKNPRIFLNRSN